MATLVFDCKYESRSVRRKFLHQFIQRMKPGDCLQAHTIADLGNSMAEVFAFVAEVMEKGFYVLTEDGLDTRKDGWGDSVHNIMRSLSAIEKERFGERVKVALAARKAEGVKLGRPKTITDETMDAILDLILAGHTIRAVAKVAGISHSRIVQVLGPTGRKAGRRKKGSLP